MKFFSNWAKGDWLDSQTQVWLSRIMNILFTERSWNHYWIVKIMHENNLSCSRRWFPPLNETFVSCSSIQLRLWSEAVVLYYMWSFAAMNEHSVPECMRGVRVPSVVTSVVTGDLPRPTATDATMLLLPSTVRGNVNETGRGTERGRDTTTTTSGGRSTTAGPATRPVRWVLLWSFTCMFSAVHGTPRKLESYFGRRTRLFPCDASSSWCAAPLFAARCYGVCTPTMESRPEDMFLCHGARDEDSEYMILYEPVEVVPVPVRRRPAAPAEEYEHQQPHRSRRRTGVRRRPAPLVDTYALDRGVCGLTLGPQAALVDSSWWPVPYVRIRLTLSLLGVTNWYIKNSSIHFTYFKFYSIKIK